MIDMKCSIDSCTREAHTKCMCGMHYKRAWRYGNPNTIHVLYRLPETKCSVNDCTNMIGHSDNLCNMHHQRMYRYSRLDNVIAPKGAGTINAQGYCVINGIYQHRTVAENKLGRQLKPDEIVHHIDGDRSNNDPNNLQVLASQSEHMKLHMRKAKTTKRDD